MAYTYKTHGIILRRAPHRERDKIFRIYTRNYGKILARAISARKVTSKLSGHLEPFIVTDLFFARSKTIDIIAGSSTLSAHTRLRSSLPHSAATSFFVDVLESFTHSHQKDEAVFDYAVAVLQWFNHNPMNTAVLYGSLLQLWSLLGYHLNLYDCHQCKNPVSQEGIKFHFDVWTVECGNCTSVNQTMKLSADALKVIRVLYEYDFSRISQLVVPGTIWLEVDQFVRNTIRYHNGSPLQSESVFLSVMNSAASPQQSLASA